MSEQALQQNNKTFSAVLPAKEWSRIFNLLKSANDDFWMTATKEGVGFKAMDPGHVTLVMVEYPASTFAHYDVGGGDVLETGVSLEKLNIAIKNLTNKNELVAMDIEDGRLVLSTFGNTSTWKGNRYSLNALNDNKVTMPPIDDAKLGLDNAFEITPELLDSILKDAKAANIEFLEFTIRENLYPGESRAVKTLWVNGNDADGTGTTYHAEAEEWARHDGFKAYFKPLSKGEPLSNTVYGVDWLSAMLTDLVSSVKATAKEKERADYQVPVLTFRFADKRPMKVELPAISSGGKLSFYLAPRVK